MKLLKLKSDDEAPASIGTPRDKRLEALSYYVRKEGIPAGKALTASHQDLGTRVPTDALGPSKTSKKLAATISKKPSNAEEVPAQNT